MGSTVRALLVLVIAEQRGLSMARAPPEATMGNMKQNLWFAPFYNGLGDAAGGEGCWHS
jgi:cation transport ATPase